MKLRPRALSSWLAASALFAPAALAQTLVRSVNGPAGAQYGRACIRIPDQNGDGYNDLLVGAPGYNGGCGAIYCLSGAYLGLGIGSMTLWSYAPAASSGDRFGHALADVGDITGDGVHDFLVGQPGYDGTALFNAGAVRLINGASHTAVSLITGGSAQSSFGTAFAACGDTNGNGKPEIAIGAPGPGSTQSFLFRMDGANLTQSNGIFSLMSGYNASNGADEYGAAIQSGFDIDGDGYQEFAVGMPGHDNGALVDAGLVQVWSNGASGFHVVDTYASSIPGGRLGASVDGGGDYDGDGIGDILAGAPKALNGAGDEAGSVVVLSGAALLANAPSQVIRTLKSSRNTAGFDNHFGTAVRACGDLNGDGIGEIMVGAPGYVTNLFGLYHRGLVDVFSGASGAHWTGIIGIQDQLGDALLGAVRDFDNDGFKEFVFAGSFSDAGGTDSGVLMCYRLFPIAPATYCTAKVNSLGCTPSVSFTGTPSAQATAPFAITASNVVNQKSGLLFYGEQPTSVAFQGGFKCVASPTRRTLGLNSGGSTSGSDCTGSFSFDFNAWIASGIDPSLVAGSEAFAQFWSRDPGSPSLTNLSNAIRFVVNP